MKIKALVPFIVIGFVIAFAYHFIAIAAIDAPHNESNNVSCGSCHGEGVLESVFWGGSGTYDRICTDKCHTQPFCPYTELYGPSMKTHEDSDENKLAECRTCHDPHYQKQKNYKNTDWNNLYLAYGTITSYEYYDPDDYEVTYFDPNLRDTSVLAYSSITYKTTTGWDATRLTGKTEDCRRTILFPNERKLGYSYVIIAIEEVTPTSGTITVKGDVTPVYQYISTSDFAVIYGQFIRDNINSNPVKLFDQVGANSFADGDGIYDGICEVCHTQPDAPHFEATQCTTCHDHSGGLTPSSGDCMGCHSLSFGERVAVSQQFNSNSHHVQDVSLTGAHCYQCHWEAKDDGTINNPYHEGYNSETKTYVSGEKVDLVVYGGGTRPTTYTAGTTAIQYMADGSRAEIKKLNDHCISCHSDQNDLTEPFGDGKTPKEYAWDNSSIDARYSQAGTTTWGKYGEGIELAVINESFETNPGYDETWIETVDDTNCPPTCFLDPDAAIPGTAPPGAGVECLQLISSASSSPAYTAYATRNYGLELPKTLTSFYLYVDNIALVDSSGKYVGALQNSSNQSVFIFRLYQNSSGQLIFNLRLYNDGGWQDYGGTTLLSIQEWHRIDIEYDTTDDTWEWKFDGEIQDSGSLTGTHHAGIKKGIFGFGQTGQAREGIIYYDLISVVGEYPANFTPKATQTKSYSAHGNATGNQGGWDLNETWTDTRNGSEDIACFDCHNSHGSNVVGPTTSYTSDYIGAPSNGGGILKDTEAGKGGYSIGYEPQEGGSTEDKNAYNAGAGLCFDCHMNANEGTTPWGYQGTYGATQEIMGYRDTPFFGAGLSGIGNKSGTTVTDTDKNFNLYLPPIAGYVVVISDDAGNKVAKGPVISNTATSFTVDSWTSLYGGVPDDGEVGYYFSITGPQQRFPYKSLEPPYKQQYKGGHFGASSELTGLPGNLPPDKATINGLCTPCHDPHGVSPTLNQEYSVPLLKGTWLTSIYKEDRAPANDVAGTMRTDRGKEGAYYIDQNTFSSDIGDTVTGIQEETYDDFAGLCKKCHTKASLTDGEGDGTWMSVDKIHESVKGWDDGVNTKHKYPCSKCHAPHNARLPRLMVTNCLDKRHKGRMVNNPEPVIQGSGNGYITGPLNTPIICDGDAEELGFCPPVLYCTPNCDDECCYEGSGCPGNPVCDPHYVIKTHIISLDGQGSGGFPGKWQGGWNEINSPPFWPQYENSVTCHESVTGTDTDQGWNTKTEWYDDTVKITSGPTAGPFTLVGGTDMQATITWTTDLDSTSYVDFGLTSSYGSTQGDSTPDTDHDITLTTLPENHQTYHYRVRSAGDLGTEAISGDNTFYISFPPSVPSLTPEPNTACAVPCDVTLEWLESTDVDGGPIQYYAEAYETETAATQSSDWTDAINWTDTFSPGHWCWKVKARDGNHTEAESDWSSEDCFTSASPPSVPVIISEPDFASPSVVTVTLEWLPSVSPLGNLIEYQVQVNDSIFFGTPKFESDWVSDPQWSVALDPVRTWYWRVRARDAVYTEAMSGWAATDIFIISSCDPPAPELIDEPHLTSGVPVDVELQWNEVTAPDGDDVEYYVQVSDDPAFSVFTESGWISGLSWTVTITDPDKTWYWRVKTRDAVHQSAESPWSDTDTFIVSLTIGPPPAPELIDEPTNIYTPPAFSVNVQLQWNTVTAPDGDPVEYYVQISGGGNYNSGWISGTSFTQSLWTNRNYYWKVKARDKFHPEAESPWSEVDSFGIWQSNPPPTPELVDELDFSADVPVDVTLNWNSVIDPDGDPVEYYYQVSAYSTFIFPVASGTTSDTYCTVTLTTATTWYWRVQARDDKGASSEYASDSFTITSIATPPPAPTLTPEDDYATDIPVDVTLEWEDLLDAPDGDDVQYYVYISGGGFYNSGWLSEAEAFCDGSTCNWTKTLDNGAAWSWRVQARDAVHTDKVSPWSDTDSFTTYSSYPPPTPALTDELDIESNVPVAVTFEWEDVDDPEGDDVLYSVQVDDFSNFFTPNYQSGLLTEGEASCDTITCSWTKTIAAGNTWYWRVQAQDDTGVPSPWANYDTFVISYTYPDEPSAPTLINEPDDVSTVAIDVTLQWIPVTCPDGHDAHYYVEVDDDPDFGSPIPPSGWIPDTNWTAPDLDPDIMWHWRVKARDSVHTGLESVWSGGDSFKIHLPIINESFEKNIISDGTGYDDGPWTGYGDVTYTDPDAAIPGTTPPADAGSECLQSISSDLSDPQYKSFAKIDYGSEEPKTFTRMYFYVEAEDLEDGNNKYIGAFQDSSNNDVIRLRLNQNAGNLRLRVSVFTNGVYENYYANIVTSTWYRLDVKYDNTDNTWESRLSDVDGTLLDYASGTLQGTEGPTGHYTGIQKWSLGFMLGSQAYTGIIYYDLFVVNIISYY